MKDVKVQELFTVSIEEVEQLPCVLIHASSGVEVVSLTACPVSLCTALSFSAAMLARTKKAPKLPLKIYGLPIRYASIASAAGETPHRSVFVFSC